jgi:hypothetical protein
MQINENRAAIQRGVRAAMHWKKTRNRIKKWDLACVTWAIAHKLPSWSGHTPLVLLIAGLLITALTCGYFLLVFFLLPLFYIAGYFWLLGRPTRVHITNSEDINSHSSERTYHSTNSNGSDGSMGS